MNGEGLCKRSHPIDRHRFDRAPGTERARVEPPRKTDKMSRFSVEVAAQLLGMTELFGLQHALCPNVAKGSRQLVMVRIATRQAVIVDENLELAFAQRRAVEMRQIIHRRAGRMHGRLVDQMYPAE